MLLHNTTCKHCRVLRTRNQKLHQEHARIAEIAQFPDTNSNIPSYFSVFAWLTVLCRQRRSHQTSAVRMRRFRLEAPFVLPLGLLLLRSLLSPCHGNSTVQPEEACEDFSTGRYPSSAWTLDTCIEVWTRCVRTVPIGLQQRLANVHVWGKAASELRRVGSPCLVASTSTSDGAGSSTIRHLATWISAEEMGCDWVSQTGVKST